MAKIIFIACKYDYGKPEMGLSYEYYNFYDSLVKMNNGNNRVIYFPFDELSRKFGPETMNKKLLEKVQQEKPDLCFFFLFAEFLEKEVVREITEKSGALTFNWFADDHWHFYDYSKHWAPCFHWVSTTDPKAVEKYYKIGYKNVILSQWACNHFLYKPLNLPKIYDVSFVGQPHPNRRKLIREIEKAGIRLECFGRGWRRGKVSQEEMIKIFSQSKVNLNFSKSGRVSCLRTVAKIFLKKKVGGGLKFNQPKFWLGNLKAGLAQKRNQIKGRNFEVLGCGSFLLTNYVEGLEEYYKIGKEVVCYQNKDDLIDKIKYYLKNEKEREAIAKAGYQRTFQDHIFEKRFNEIFKIIFEK